MLFNSSQPISKAMADAILRSARAIDTFAHVQVDMSAQQIRISGKLTPEQAISALEKAGCVTRAKDEAEHVSGTSTCCGGCS